MQPNSKAINRMACGLVTVASLLVAGTVYAQSDAEVRTDFRYLPAVKTHWIKRALLLDIARANGRLVAVGERGIIIHSDDDGSSWVQADVPVSVTLTAVNFPSPQMGWAVGHEGTILHSSDGGTSWSVQFTGLQIAGQEVAYAESLIAKTEQQIETAEESEIEELEFALEEAGYALDDAMVAVEAGGTANPLLDVWFADEKSGFAVGAYGLIFSTDDGGENWKIRSSDLDNPDKYHYYSMASANGQTLYLSGEAGMLFRSDDAGATWIRLESPYEGSLFGVIAMPNGSTARVLSFGLRGNIFVSDDMGETWEKRSVASQNTLMGGVISPGGRLVLVGRSGAVLSSDDAGETFSIVIREDRSPYSAVIANPDESLVLVGEGGIHRATPDGSAEEQEQ
jgi:photosystem II stability/assembly factor-like uncharacterized protein